MTPDQVTDIADKAAHAAAQPYGVVWFMVIVIGCLFFAVLFLAKWMLAQIDRIQATSTAERNQFIEHLQAANKEMVTALVNNTAAFETCIEESKCTRELIRRIEMELKIADRSRV